MKHETNGVYGEYAFFCAVNPIIPITWDRHQTLPLGAADFETWIDTKCVMHKHYQIHVQSTHHPEWAYFLVNGYAFPWMLMDGWLWGYDLKPNVYADRPYHHPTDFMLELARRKTFG